MKYLPLFFILAFTACSQSSNDESLQSYLGLRTGSLVIIEKNGNKIEVVKSSKDDFKGNSMAAADYEVAYVDKQEKSIKFTHVNGGQDLIVPFHSIGKVTDIKPHFDSRITSKK